MNDFRIVLFQLRNPFFNITTLWVKFLLLLPRIEYSEIRLCIATSGRCPLPISIVHGWIIIDQMVCKKSLPKRQSRCRSFTRNEAAIILTLLCIKPVLQVPSFLHRQLEIQYSPCTTAQIIHHHPSIGSLHIFRGTAFQVHEENGKEYG